MKKYIAILIWIALVGIVTNAEEIKNLGYETLLSFPCMQERIESGEQSDLIESLRAHKNNYKVGEEELLISREIIEECVAIYEKYDNRNNQIIIIHNQENN